LIILTYINRILYQELSKCPTTADNKKAHLLHLSQLLQF